jgi:flagellar operon protein
MAVDKLTRINQTTVPKAQEPTGRISSQSGPSFQDALEEIKQQGQNARSDIAGKTEALKFSNHAVERMQARGIHLNSSQLDRLQKGVEKAAEKGGRNSLVFLDDAAMIVSVKNNTVVTVVDKNSLKENVFTNIDSTVVV